MADMPPFNPPIFRLEPPMPGYFCVVCGHFIPAVDGVIVHDVVPHPVGIDFNEEARPQ